MSQAFGQPHSDIPRQIDRYEIGPMLGEGAFGIVCQAYDPNLDRRVAIKILNHESTADPEICRRFIREARLMRALESPGVVTVYTVDETPEGRPYLVMELCERGTLGDRLKWVGRALTMSEVHGLIEALAISTGTLHHPRPDHPGGIIHRDLKPSNYLIRNTEAPANSAIPPILARGEQLVVADLGLAKAVDADASRLTVAGGTRAWSAPEQFTGMSDLTTAADVYALSAIVLYALSEEVASPGEAPPLGAQLAGALRQAGPLAPVLERSLSPDPQVRPPNVFEWRNALLGASSHDHSERSTLVYQTGQTAPDERGESTEINRSRHDGDGSARRATGARAKWAAAIVASGCAVAGLVALLAATVFRGPDVTGPTIATVGDQIAFLADDGEQVEWSANGQVLASSPSIVFEVPETGSASMTASSGLLRSTTFTVEVVDSSSALRIDGPALTAVGQTVTFSTISDGSSAGNLSWDVGGQERQGSTVSFEATEPGIVRISVTDGAGQRATRTLTVGR